MMKHEVAEPRRHENRAGNNVSADAACPSCGEEQRDKKKRISRIAFLGLLFILFIIGLVFERLLRDIAYGVINYILFIGICVAAGHNVFIAAFRNLFRGKVFDENFLMTIAAAGAIAIRALPEAAGVMLFSAIGGFFEDLAASKSRKSIKALIALRPDYALVKRETGYEKQASETVPVGASVLVKPGERIPLDGIVETGVSGLDVSALTGESRRPMVRTGDAVFAGSIALTGALTLRVTKPYTESSAARILSLVENASEAKAPTEKFITSFSRYYTPGIVALAVILALVPPFLLGAGAFGEWLHRALVLLVISCPCALMVSVPLAYFAGLGAASRRGILIKGGDHIDALAKTGTVVFDKTGTLTEGRFEVKDIVARDGLSRENVLFFAAHGEARSNHPAALAIRDAYAAPMDETIVSDCIETAGYGVKATVGGVSVLVGNDRFMHAENIPHGDCGIPGTAAYVAVDGKYAGFILIGDRVKTGSAQAIAELARLGIHKTVMLTGDTPDAARETAKALGIGEYRAGLLPEDKVKALREIRELSREKTVFAGDGINDAPVIASADVGIAMGKYGSDAAVETADVVLLDDDPGKIAEAVRLSKKTRSIVLQTIVFVLASKTAFMAFGAFGLTGLWEAVFADVGVTLLAVLNTLRILRRTGIG